MINVPKNMSSSFASSAKFQQEYETRKAKEESTSQEEQTKINSGQPTIEIEPANEAEKKKDSVNELKPLSVDELAEITKSIEDRQYYKDYAAFGGTTYSVRLWTAKEEREYRIARAKNKMALEADFKNEAMKSLGDEAKKHISAFGLNLSMDVLMLIEDAMTAFDNKYLLSRCIVAIGGRVMTPNECELMLDSMPSEQVSVLATILNEHRARYSDLAVRSIEDVNIKKSLASRQSSTNSQDQSR
jgi:hypothetical protein